MINPYTKRFSDIYDYYMMGTDGILTTWKYFMDYVEMEHGKVQYKAAEKESILRNMVNKYHLPLVYFKRGKRIFMYYPPDEVPVSTTDRLKMLYKTGSLPQNIKEIKHCYEQVYDACLKFTDEQIIKVFNISYSNSQGKLDDSSQFILSAVSLRSNPELSPLQDTSQTKLPQYQQPMQSVDHIDATVDPSVSQQLVNAVKPFKRQDSKFQDSKYQAVTDFRIQLAQSNYHYNSIDWVQYFAPKTNMEPVWYVEHDMMDCDMPFGLMDTTFDIFLDQ